MAIVLDEVVQSAPVIQERISGGQAQITGAFTPDEATDLAIVLRAGALPAPVQIVQNVTVGPPWAWIPSRKAWCPAWSARPWSCCSCCSIIAFPAWWPTLPWF